MPVKHFLAIQFEVKLPISVEKKGGRYISSCPALDVFSQGDTEEEAKKAIVEALTCFLIGCVEHGTLDAVLRQCGFTKAVSLEDAVKSPFKDMDWVTVPVQLLANEAEKNRCHA